MPGPGDRGSPACRGDAAASRVSNTPDGTRVDLFDGQAIAQSGRVIGRSTLEWPHRSPLIWPH